MSGWKQKRSCISCIRILLGDFVILALHEAAKSVLCHSKENLCWCLFLIILVSQSNCDLFGTFKESMRESLQSGNRECHKWFIIWAKCYIKSYLLLLLPLIVSKKRSPELIRRNTAYCTGTWEWRKDLKLQYLHAQLPDSNCSAVICFSMQYPAIELCAMHANDGAVSGVRISVSRSWKLE